MQRMETMTGVILEINENQILIRDEATNQEVAVNTCCVCNLAVNDRVSILYSGMMTMSIPPQISARRITRLNCRRC
ncbi:MAG: hypothetical protein K2H89_01020 [Oscillospiraceae bacterium]|nr:hypothetical protein [Oscillospiraceae bacterium]